MGHPHDELFNVDLSARPSRPPPIQERPFPCNKLPMPAQQGCRGHERIEVTEHAGAYRLGKRCQSPAFGLTEQQSPPPQFRSKQTIFGFQILNLRRGLPFEPATHARDEQR